MSASKYTQRLPALQDFVQAYIAEHGYTPSASTLSRRLGWPQTVCQGYLERLRSEISLPPSRPAKGRAYRFHRPRLLQLIQTYASENGLAPTLRSLAGESGLSTTTLRKYLRCMQDEGLVDYEPGIPRSIRVRE